MDTLHLQQRHQTWYVVVEVPRELRPYLGRRFIRSLKTTDLREARQRRHAVVAEFQARMEAERRKHSVDIGPPGSLQRALAWRQDIREARQEGREEHASHFEVLVEDEARELGSEAGQDAQSAYWNIATGRGTPLSQLIEPWLRESSTTAKTKAQRQADIARLLAWAGGEVLVESFSRKRGGKFITEHLLAAGKAPATVNRIVSSLSTCWRWLIKRGHVEANPWEHQTVSLAAPAGSPLDQEERAFTDAEVESLLSTDTATHLRTPIAPALADMMRVAALSGMRLEEIAQLRIKDTAGGLFQIVQGKTKAARREVPIHSRLVPMVAQRSAGKAPDAFLFHELSEGPFAKRSGALSKAFTRYASKVGVREVVEGKRRSLVNFHSFRRWFITKAEQAGQPINIIEAVVGHKRVGMTADRYSEGPSEKQKRAVVESVKLPELK